MRIVTWNVNGIRAILRKGVWNQIVKLDSDIVCLQEIKAKPDQIEDSALDQLKDYQINWNPAEKSGYSGVATFVKNIPQKTVNGFGIDTFDSEGRVIQSFYDEFVLMNVYFPNGQRDQGRLNYKLLFYEKLLDYCNTLRSSGSRIIICGDFNTAHNEIDLKNAKNNQKTSGFLPEERIWIDKYLNNEFVDIYRHLYPTKIQYTWWTYITNARERNVGWRLDYFLITEDLVQNVKESTIHDNVPGSDHCPVSIDLKF